MDRKTKIASILLYGGLSREEYQRVKEPVAESNLRALTYWSVLVCVFWLYCLAMSLRAEDYALCRPAYTTALSLCILSYFFARYLVPRFPQALVPCMSFFRLSLLGGGIGIAVCQPDMRSLTIFAVSIMLPSIFIDNTANSLLVHVLGILLYILMGRNVIVPDIYSWGLENFALFSVFGLLIGNAINKARYERVVFADSAKKLVEIQTRYAYYDPMTGLKNRRAYEEKLEQLTAALPHPYCIVMIDINGLKKMNDTQGHGAGDELIIGTAECMREAFPGTEDIYRLGGDEFSVVVPEDEERVRLCMSAMLRSAAEWKGQYVNGISLAAGMSSDREASDIDTIEREADARMYAMKEEYYAGRERDDIRLK